MSGISGEAYLGTPETLEQTRWENAGNFLNERSGDRYCSPPFGQTGDPGATTRKRRDVKDAGVDALSPPHPVQNGNQNSMKQMEQTPSMASVGKLCGARPAGGMLYYFSCVAASLV